MPKVAGVLQARYSSTRLPGKVLMPILGEPMLFRQIERLERSTALSSLIVATSTDPADDAIAELCESRKVNCYRGSLDDVLDRVYQGSLLSHLEPADHVVRLTGDCPLTDHTLIDTIIQKHIQGDFDYTSNSIEVTYPDGLDVEVMKFRALKEAWSEAKLLSQREHVTPFIYGNPQSYKIFHFKNDKNFSELRWTVDDQRDFDFVKQIYEELYRNNKDFNWNDILELLKSQPKLKDINSHAKRNEGYEMSLKKDEFQKRYKTSIELLKRAQNVIPLGTQTFSKSKTQYPEGVSPHFIKSGKGSKVWDVDGNQYTDFINSLCAVNLGYCDRDVDLAVTKQLQEGVIFSLPHVLEVEVAEMMTSLIPSAEAVRFGKNGSDATTGAVRLARAYTKRDHIAACGYHGWQDWFIGTTARNKGVPQATKALTHLFTYNKIESLGSLFKEYPGQIAAVIMEPMNTTYPENGFLQEVKALAHKNGALLIFDETITGFRYGAGGAQELFKVTPDISTFGKGMANGFPISAVVGRADIMALMEEVFFSFTFGGETLSLAAALATMKKIKGGEVIPHLYKVGEKLVEGVKSLIEKHGVSDFISISGNPTWTFLTLKDFGSYTMWQLKTLFLQEVFAQGILTLGSHNMSYAHSEDDISNLLKTYDSVFETLKHVIENRNLEKFLCTKALEPLFKVR